ERNGRYQIDVLVLARRTNVGELLFPNRVHHQIVVAAVYADDHALVERVLGRDEHASALLQLPQRVGHGLAVVLADQHAVAPLAEIAFLDVVVIVENVAHDTGATGQVEEVGLKADEAPCRDPVFQTRAATAVRGHVKQFALAAPELFHHPALVAVLDVDGQELVGFLAHAVNVLEQHARAGHGQLVAFTTHVLDEDGQVQLATATHLE